MVLKLKSLRLKNWKCYENERIEFNLDSEHKIWIVFGQNGYGKTSIIEAIQWCLYGSDAISSAELPNCFNRVAIKKNPELELSVQLTFAREGNIYDINRNARRIIRGANASAQADEANVQINGIHQGDARERIEELFPKSCKEFFFFDGVEIKRYAQHIHTPETLNAIERILGIPELRNLREDTKRALGILEKKMRDAGSTNEDLIKVTMKLTDIQEEIETKIDQLKIAKEEYEAAIVICNDVKERARQIEALLSKLNKLTDLEREISRKQEYLNEAEKEVETTVRQAPIPLLLEFVREVSEEMQSTTITTARRSGSVAQLQELLESDNCVCGRCIDESARQYILQELGRWETISVSRSENALRQDDLRSNLAVLSRYQTPDLDKLLLNRDRLREELEEFKQAAYRLKKETKEINGEEAQAIWKKVGEAEEKAKEKQDKIERFNREIEVVKQEEDKLRRDSQKLASQNKETANLAGQVELAKSLYKAAEELIEWRIAERKETIENCTSDIHRRVTNKPDEYIGVEIRKDYTLGIKNAAGAILSPETLSAGEKEALAFSFIAGLNLASGTAAPLIMDTPFGHLDTNHQKNLINSLPDIPSQVIVLATDRDFPDYLLQGVRSHVTGILKIKRLGATEDASTVEVAE
jgi:DNA sulfur modification protein DndD